MGVVGGRCQSSARDSHSSYPLLFCPPPLLPRHFGSPWGACRHCWAEPKPGRGLQRWVGVTAQGPLSSEEEPVKEEWLGRKEEMGQRAFPHEGEKLLRYKERGGFWGSPLRRGRSREVILPLLPRADPASEPSCSCPVRAVGWG